MAYAAYAADESGKVPEQAFITSEIFELTDEERIAKV